MKHWNQKKRARFWLISGGLFLFLILLGGSLASGQAMVSDLNQVNQPPSGQHLFGTDWLGRDMFLRTLKGLSLSIFIGTSAAAVSAVLSLILGTGAAVLGKRADALISYLIDLIMGIPHLLLLILISLACGRGLVGVVTGIMLTHWPSLARVIRGEILQLKESPYILLGEKLGSSKLRIAVRHMLPKVLPQFLTGIILMFPHAILHEASITFLGFGLSSEQPAIGIILAESMKYLIMGNWWLAVFPGAMLVAVVLLFQRMGEFVRKLTDPASAHE